MIATKLRLGSLGSRNTFGAEAAQLMIGQYDVFGDIVYFPTTEDAMRFDGCDALCAPQQMSKTGLHSRMQSRVAVQGSVLYIVADVSHGYHCSLLIKPGADAKKIRRILGHTGSVTQSRDWIEAHLPWAAIEIVETSSMGAAAEVAGSDGTTASIGTPGMAAEFALEQYGTEIDGHSVGSYWALSPHPLFSERPNRVVVAGRFADGGHFSDLIAALLGAGFRVHSVFPLVTGKRLYEYDYTICCSGDGALAAVQAALAPFTEARLAGAYVSHDGEGV
jgi:prephenate dehydratase